ncbi:MAG TPA: TIM-barrel domain-containing protein, partial [Cyclobacteriaceae bacterium]
AAFSPFFRAHTMINTRDSEPWSYGEEVEQICRNYIALRYQLLPYIYSLFYQSSQTGEPIQRSLAVDYTFSPEVYDHLYHNQYTLGQFILVAPVESNRGLLKVYLPEGEWYYLFDGKKYHGHQEIIIESPIHKLPVFLKGGAILPMQKRIASTNEKTEELILHIYNGGPSQFEFYQDNGETFDYQTGAFAKRNILFDPEAKKIILSKTEGEYSSPFKKIKLMLHGFDHSKELIVGNKKYELITIPYSFFTPLEKYDPIHDPDTFGEEILKTTEIAYTKEEVIFTW